MKSQFLVTMAAFCLATLLNTSQAQVLISEMMASNTKSFTDQDADYSDWIELYNAGTNAVNLGGWFLTDDKTDLRRWRFPDTPLLPGKFLVVVASNKDRHQSGAELHTNFKLSGDGEFLALVQPDGVTIASQFAPVFPPQVPDVSYGFGIERISTPLIQAGAAGRWLVPLGVGIDPRWTDPAFDDSSWKNGTNGFGFSRSTPEVPSDYKVAIAQSQPLAWWSFEETAGTNALNTLDTNLFPAFYRNGALVNQISLRGPTPAGFDTNNLSPKLDGVNDYIGTDRSLLNDRAAFTLSGWIRPATIATARMGIFGQHNVGEVGFSDVGVIQFRTEAGASVKAPYSFKSNEWHHVAAVATTTDVSLYFDGLRVGQSSTEVFDYGTSSFPFNIGGGGIFDNTGNAFKGQIDEVAVYDRALTSDEVYAQVQAGLNPVNGYGNLVATDLGDALFNTASSVLLRIPFTIADTAIDQLLLKIRYDDGFVAYLNGVEVASRYAPTTLNEFSEATAARVGSSGAVLEELDLTSLVGTIHPGTNVLSIHGFNASKADPDFLILPELWTIKTRLDTNALRYFTVSTPGAANGFGNANLGPLIRDIVHTPAVPKDDQDILVTARVDKTFDPVASVTLTYRIMYGGETNLVMFDDGLHGDGAAGDGLYGITVPVAAASTNGQMIRYAITATDSNGDTNRWPPYIDKLNSPQYMGTIVENPALTNPLPVLHWFIQNKTGADGSGGARCSFFYEGVFYDNVFMNIHGQSSQSFPKHSYNINFNIGYHFRYASNQVPVKGFNLLSTYADKSHLRNMLAYDTYRDAGSAYHVVFPLRVEQNAAFWGDANWCEDGDSDFLNRLGLDPRGSLYKMYTTFADTSGAEKKTRRTESNQDLADLLAGVKLTGANLRAYIYDNLDVPANVDFLAAMILTGGVDCCHKNYYFYHDLEGNGEWRTFPWDVDLTFGRDWNSTDTYFDDIMHPLDGLDVGSNNTLIAALLNQPAIKQMYERRIRTLMDQLLQPPGTPVEQLKYEKRMDELYVQMAPDAALDYAKWPTWKSKQTMSNAIMVLKTNYFPARRKHMYTTLSGAPGRRIPAEQTNAVINITKIDYNPASGNQAEEYVQLRNTNNFAVDISGWKLDGAIQHRFHPGTVLSTNGILYVSPDVRAFRGRRVSPKGGEGNFVQGNYKGQLSARGESITLADASGVQVSQFTFDPTPSAAQQFLRITGLMYAPKLMAGDSNTVQFEYIRLQNIGTTNLDLSGVHFSTGIDFGFSNGSITNLAPGQVVYVVNNRASFVARYGQTPNIAGEYLGNLDSNGETLRLDDASGEKILEFAYDNKWYPETDGGGSELTIRNPGILWSGWGEKTNWMATLAPVFTDTSSIAAWKAQHFSASELLDVTISGDQADPDKDGLSNTQEFIAGTDPRDGKSFLKVELSSQTGQGFVLRFNATDGKSYTVMFRDALNQGTWKKLVDVPAGSARAVQHTDTTVAGPRRFYRLVTPSSP